jgi:polyhydroxybutyrate depolymerase
MSPPRTAIVGILLLFILNLTSSCGQAQIPDKQMSGKQMPEKRIIKEQNWRSIKQSSAIKQEEASDSSDMQESITYQGQLRTYLLHTPRGYDQNRSLPLVLVFHGGYGRGKTVERQSRFNNLADQKGFFVAYPDGIDKHWNDGRLDTDNPDVDDVGFISALIDRLVKTKNIDPSRVYATGISNGGAFTHKLACDLSDKIAAFAPVASSLSVRLASTCKPNRPVPILMFNSPEDPFVPWQGGEGKGRGGVKLSVPETVEWWRKHNDCSSDPEKKILPRTVAKDGTQVTVSRYSGCRSGSEVIFYTIEGGGHTWPGGEDPLPVRVSGRISNQISATEVMWQFFQRHTLL